MDSDRRGLSGGVIRIVGRKGSGFNGSGRSRERAGYFGTGRD